MTLEIDIRDTLYQDTIAHKNRAIETLAGQLTEKERRVTQMETLITCIEILAHEMKGKRGGLDAIFTLIADERRKRLPEEYRRRHAMPAICVSNFTPGAR